MTDEIIIISEGGEGEGVWEADGVVLYTATEGGEIG
jgi:hypothetical protein